MAFVKLHQEKQILPDQFWRGDETTIHPPWNQGSKSPQAEGSLGGSLWRPRGEQGADGWLREWPEGQPDSKLGLVQLLHNIWTFSTGWGISPCSAKSLDEFPRDFVPFILSLVGELGLHSPQLEIKGCWDNFISAYKPQAGGSEGVNTDVSVGVRAVTPRQGCN